MTYYCARCKGNHRWNSAAGMRHAMYASTPGECGWCAEFRDLGNFVCTNCGRVFPENKGGSQSSN